MRKKFLLMTFLLAIIGFCGTNLSAENTGVAKVGDTEYAKLADAVNAAQADDEIKVIANIATNLDLTISKKVTLDLGGFTLSDAGIIISSDVTIKNGKIVNTNKPYPLKVTDSGNLTVDGVAIEASKSDRAIWLDVGSSVLNFKSGSSILATKGTNNEKSKIYGVWVAQGATANIYGGTITVDAGANATAVAIFGNYENTVNIYGGKISTSGKNYSYAVWVDGNVTITGGEIVTNEKKYGYSSGITYGYNYAIYSNGDVEISGDTEITTYGHSGYIVNAGGSKQEVNIAGGKFTNVLSEVDETTGGHHAPYLINGSSVAATIAGGDFNGYGYDYDDDDNGVELIKGTGSTLTITGGSFDNKPEDDYVALGATITVDETTYTKTEDGLEEVIPVASVNGTSYTDLQDAIVAAAPSGTVEILSDVTVDKWIMFSETLNIGSGQIITMNINGLTINGNDKTVTINSIESAGNGGYLIFDATKLNVKDLTIKYADGLVGGIGLKSGTINNVTFIGGNYGVFPGANGVTIEDCTFIGTKSSAVYYEEGRQGIVVKNNSFNTADGAYAITMRSNEQFTGNTINKGRVNIANSSSATVTGNNFGQERFKVYNAATATISGNTINNLVFNDNSVVFSTFGENTLSTEAQDVLDAASFPVAQIGTTKYGKLEDAFAAATEGQTITLLADATPALTSQRAITKAAVIDLGGKTLTLTEDDLYFGTTEFKNGNIIVDPSVKPSTAVFWMFANQTLTFDNVNITATDVTGTYLIGLDGNNSDLNILNGSEIIVNNATALDLDIICVNASTGNDIVVDDSKVNVKNLDGRVFFRGNYTIKGDSDIDLDGITKAGFRIEAGQTLSIEDNATVDIIGAPRDGGIHLTDLTATYTVAETATVNATVNQPVAVAQIGTTKYGTLQAAINAAVNDDVVTLLTDNAENVTVTQKPDVKFTIDGADKTMTGTITIDGKSAAYATAGITIKNVKFDANNIAKDASINLGGNNSIRYTNGVTVDNCTFTGTGKAKVAVKNYTGGCKNVTITNCTATGLHSLAQLKTSTTVTLTNNTVSECKNGVSLGSSTGVTVTECVINVEGYGIRPDGGSSVDVTDVDVTDSEISAFIPVVVRNATNNASLTFNGTNTFTATNTDGLWCAIGTSEYETNGQLPTAPTGQVTVTLNDTGLSMDGVYGEHFALNGEGTAESPYLINNLYELKGFRDLVDTYKSDGSNQFAGKYFKLTNDIDLNGINWDPIGTMSADHGSFKGVFDGGDHTIYNLHVEQAGNGIGLFAHTTGNAVIKNLKLNNVTVESTDNSNYVGGLVGNAYASTKIENVHVSGNVYISGRGYIGGIAGHGYVVMDNVSVVATGDGKGNNKGLITSTFWCAGGVLGYAGEGATNIMNARVENVVVTSAAGGLGAIVGMAEDNNGTQPISGSNLSAENVEIKTYTGAYGDTYANYALGYLYGGNPTSILTGDLSVEEVTIETSTGEAPEVNDAVAKIGNSIYFNLQAALNAAVENETITLLRDIKIAERTEINNRTLTLDGNDKTLTYTGTDRAIDVPNKADADIDFTIKDLTIYAETANRGINYNENGTLNVDNVTVTIGKNVDGYAINFPGMADNAQVTIKDSKLTSRNPLNIWGENMVIDVYDSEIISVDNSTTYDYAAIQLNNEIPTVGPNGAIANGTVVNVYGGVLTATDEKGEPSNVVANATETGVVNISDETVVTGKVLDYVANIGGAYFGSLQAAVNAIEKQGYNSPIVIMKSFATSETATVKNGLNVTINLNGKTITGTDTTSVNFSIIDNRGNLTITDNTVSKEGKITLTATIDSDWNRYSAVIANNPGGKLTIDAGTLEHLGGTDMAYGIDNLTNGKGTYAETVINGGTIKSTYRGIRQFLNGVEAQNILTVNGGTIEGANKSIWMQDPNKNANTGTLTVGEDAALKGDVYLFVTANSTEWPVEVSIASAALKDGAQVLTANVPAGYELQQDADGNYVVNQGVAKIGDVLYATVTEAINAAENGGTVQLLALTIDEYVAPWITDTQHTSEKSITIVGSKDDEGKLATTLTAGMYLGYEDGQCREHTIVVKDVKFEGKGLKVACQQNVTIEGNTFSNITEGQAIAVVGKNIKSVVKNNVIDGVTTSNPGIELRNTLTATVEGNTISNTGHNALQITSQEFATESAIAVTNNKMSNWGTAQNAQGELEGRAMRISNIVTADVNNNVMINVNAPEEFVKITGHTTAKIDENYWNGANPTSSNTPAYFLAEGVQVHNYYAAYDAESNTLSDLVTIEGAGETLEIFYTAAGVETTSDNAAYSLMFTVTDYASKEVSVKIGNKKPAENKGCDLLIPSSVKFNDQDFAVTSIPVEGFKECKGFDKLVVPGTITSVSNSAFYNCSRLTEVVIGEGVQKLGSNTFYKISDLQTLTLPSTLTKIESLCFRSTENIETIVCNAQTPPTAFTGSFTEAVYKNALLYVDGKYEDYKAANGWSNFKNILAVGATQTIDKDRYTLIATITDVWNRTCSVQIGTAPTNTKRAELAIPEHVSFSGIEFDITSIPESGFQDCKYFEGTLTIPAYITSIGKNAFEGCSAVTALVVDEGVTSLGTSDTFNGCRNIETITLPSTLTKIPTRCFHNILQKLQVVECHALVPPTLASQFTPEAYNSATLYVHDVDAYKEANNWKGFKSIRLIGAVAQNKETEVEYKSIAEAVAAANAGETVQMLQNVDLENTITVAAGKEVVLDLNGKTVSYTTTEHVGEAMITNNGNLTITDTSDEETGSLSYAYEGGADPSYGFGNSTIENKGVLTINAGTVQNTSEAMSHASYAINTGAGATLNVEGGNIINENGHAVRMVSFDTTLNTVNIEGGYIEGTRALQVQLPGNASAAAPEMELNITGGELKSNDETYNLAIYVYSSGQSAEYLTIKIEGGTFNGNVAIYEPSVTMEANSVVVSGGTFNGAYGIYTYGVTEADQAVISIVGGTFETNYSEWWATDDNYVFEQNENGTYSVVEQTIFTQTTQLNAGWNWFSAYVDIEGVHYEDEQAVYEGLTMIQNALGTNGIQIKKQQGGFSYYEFETWFGNFAIYNKETLFINVTESQELTIVGEIVNPEDHTITLNPNWTWIGYPLNVTMSMSEAFELAGLTPSDGDIVKHQDDFASYLYIDESTKGWIGDFDMNPGEGFMYMNNSTSSKQLTYKYPTNSNNRSETRANVTTEVNHWTPNASQYPNNMTMMAMVDIEGGDYEVAAFVDGEVRGSARPIYVEALDSYMLFLTIHGEGVEEMTFKFYDLTTGEEFDLNDRMNYSDNAIVGSIKEPYMFNRGTTGIGEASLSEINIYPNPTTTGTEINLQATCDKVEVFNALGVKVAEYQNVDSIDAIETAGIYVIRITNNGNVQNCRLVVK